MQLPAPPRIPAWWRPTAAGVLAGALLGGIGRTFWQQVGNYNRTRYCRDRGTEYARLALEALLAGAPPSAAIDGGPASGCPLERHAEAGI